MAPVDSSGKAVGQGPDGRVLVDVADDGLGVALADPADHLCRGERAAAEGEEVRVGAGHLRAEHVAPDLREPRLRRVEARGGGRSAACWAAATAGRRGRPCPLVRVGISSTTASRGTSAAGSRSRSTSTARSASNGPVDGEVADEQLVARPRRADRGGRGDHAGQAEQLVVELAELDPAPADLDLVVGTAGEDQPGRVVAHDVAGAVRALPAERRQRGVRRGVLDRVEVAGEADAADDQLARLPLGDRVALGVDDREVPARRAAGRSGPGRCRRAARRRRRRSPRWGRRCSRPRDRGAAAAGRARAGRPRRP